MKKIVTAFVLTGSILGLAACGSSDDKAVVNTAAGDVTKDDFYEALKDDYGEATLYQLVTTKVLEDQYKVEEDEVDSEIKKYKEQAEESGMDFEMWLQNEGFSDEDTFKDVIKQSLLQKAALSEGLEVTDEEIEDQYDRMNKEIDAQHILVEDEETANEVVKKIDKDEDFEELAKEYSSDGSAEDGGNLGYFSVGDMVPEFEEAAYNMKEGDVSDPVQSQFGFHIIKVNDIRDSEDDIGSLEDNEKEIKDQLLTEKISAIDPAEAQAKIDKIIEDAKVEVKIEEFEDLFEPQAPAEEAPVEE